MSRLADDPYTRTLRLCDDVGMVSGEPVTDWVSITPPMTYLGRLNNLRAHTFLKPVTEPFACTGSAHLAAEHIKCTSPVHEAAAEPRGNVSCVSCFNEWLFPSVSLPDEQHARMWATQHRRICRGPVEVTVAGS